MNASKWPRQLLLLCVLLAPALAPAQVGLYNVFVKSSRVALLPFSNPAETPESLPMLMSRVRSELKGKSVELADSEQVAGVLRRHRIRNTSELTVEQIQAVSHDLEVSYLVVGSVEIYRTGEQSSEVSLSARLVNAATMSLEWSSSVSVHSDDQIAPLEIGRVNNMDHLDHQAVERLFESFRYSRPRPNLRVDALKIAEDGKATIVPCRKVVVLTFANETKEHAAGQILTDQVLTELLRAGFEIADPGRMRETMKRADELTQGEVSLDVLQKCRADLGVDFVITGTVSECASQRFSSGADDPTAACEARIVDTSTGRIVWATTLTRRGSDSQWLFGTGGIHGIGAISNRVAHDLVAAIPKVRHKQPLDSLEAARNDH